MILRNTLHPNEHITKARFCAIFSDAWNKTASVGRAANGFECIGIMSSSVDIVPEYKSTPASLFEPSRTTTTTAATVATTNATLSSCSLMALPLVISSQNGDTVDITASTSNTTNKSASNSISNVKNILTNEKRRHQGNESKTFGPPYLGSKSGRTPK
jgi:hypothetical protein